MNIKPPLEAEAFSMENSQVGEQLKKSEEILSELEAFGNDFVENIKIANDRREYLRRNFEAVQRESLLSELHKESLQADEKIREILEKWSEMEEIREPVGLHEQLQIQKQRIENLMQDKDDMIAMCQSEWDRMNEMYASELEKQEEELNQLVERVNGHIENMTRAYKEHLNIVESAMENERREFVKTARENFNNLLEVRENDDIEQLAKSKEAMAFHASEKEEITLKYEELIRSTRIRLENEAEALELELRNTKSNILLAQDQMFYNQQVLKKREEENATLCNQKKKRLAKLKGLIATLENKLVETRTNCDEEIKKLTQDILKLHTNIHDLGKKSKRLSTANRKKLDTVRAIGQQEIKDLIDKMEAIDKILHEEVLGIEWQGGNEFERFFLPQPSENLENTQEESKMPEKPRAFNVISMAASERRILRKILLKIAERADFLIDQTLNEELERFSDQQKAIVKIDNIFKALEINPLEIMSLIDFFMPYAWCPNCTPGGIQREKYDETMTPTGDDPSTCSDHYYLIESESVPRVLRQFTEHKLNEMKSKNSKLVSNSKKDSKPKEVLAEFSEENWNKYYNTVLKDRQKLWSFLENVIKEYHQGLKRRKTLRDDCESLRRQNEELEFLLSRVKRQQMNETDAKFKKNF